MLLSTVDPTAGDVKGALLTRDAEIRHSDLVWLDSVSEGEQDTAITELEALGIRVRGNVDLRISTQET